MHGAETVKIKFAAGEREVLLCNFMNDNMVKKFLILVSVVVMAACSGAERELSPAVIPVPGEVKAKKEQFVWNNSSVIVVSENDPQLQKNAEYLKNILGRTSGREVGIRTGGTEDRNAVILSLDASVAGEEAYELDVDKRRVSIKASGPAGIFYGIQTLLQLMPAEVARQGALAGNINIQGVAVKDSPRFGYRGMHLDVSRHFMTKDEVKKFIDLISMYKFNRFHWHLTDGVGWRMEVKGYPLLTKKTAFRPTANLQEFWNGDRRFCDEGTPGANGGYYTHEDIKEVVAYAAERHITVIPEIEMPGHSEEVFVAYPELCCSGKPYTDGDFCAGNEKTFEFLEEVLDEVMELFPSEYIHIGGDEAGKGSWKKCPKCMKRMKDNDLGDVDGLQSYFVRRVADYLKSKGRKVIGWDEILEGGMDPDVAIMVWRGEDTGAEAAKKGHKVIMTPGRYCYFDHYQANPVTEPEAIGGYLPMERVYGFEPVTDKSVSTFIMGGQGNIWTEYMPDFPHVEYMAFPRAIALSEVLWSEPEDKDWVDFKRRLGRHSDRLDYMDVNYHRPSHDIIMVQEVDTVNKRIGIILDSEQYMPEIRYTLDGSVPTPESELFKDKFYVGGRNTVVTAAVFENGEPMEPYLRKPTGYHLGIGKKVTYNTTWETYSAGGETALVDGKKGGLNYSDNLWQGFTRNMDVVIDLGKVTELGYFNANFMQLTGPGVYMPRYVEVSLSEDGESFEPALKIGHDIPEDHDRLIFHDFSGNLGGKKARYVKVFAGKNRGFIFVDELVLF